MKRCFLTLLLLVVAAAFPGSARADSSVSFNEIMYHSANNETFLEWVELRNQMAVDVDISGWSITGGIQYTFASNTIVRGGGFKVVALSPVTMIALTGSTNIVGPFLGRLSNNGDTLRLRNNSGRVVDEVSYGVEGDWPVAPDGSGVSLAKRDRDGASGPAANWTASEQMGGTPGVENFAVAGAIPPDTRHVSIDASWKYEASGADLGTAWRNAAYDDSAWSSRSNLSNRVISGLFNTGVGANGVVLANNTPDPHYLLTANANGGTGTNALAILNHPSWLANDTISSFIGVLNPGNTTINGGNYFFQTTFSLAGFIPATAQLNIAVAVDNDLTDIFINGVGSGLAASGFAAFSAPMTLASGFVSGVNTVEFRTVNQGAGPGGFRATLSGSAIGVNTNSPLPLGRPTYYFRKSFAFSGDPAYTKLQINPIIADGAVVYLNGVEVFRQNMPGGPPAYATAALSDVVTPGYSGLAQIPAGSLVVGNNVLAVEVHQAAGSADAPIFGADLISTPLPVPPVAVLTLAFNELSASTNAEFWLELVNYGTSNIPLAGYVIFRDGVVNNEYIFPSGPSISAGGYRAVTNTTLGFHPVDGDKLYLLPPARDKVIDAVVLKQGPRARSPEGTGPFLRPSAPSPGGANSFAFHDEIVINEIMYDHKRLPSTNGLPPAGSSEKWVELYNKSSNAVDLTGWAFDGGVRYNFSAGQMIAGGGYLVVAGDAAALRAKFPGVGIVGDFSGNLSGRSDHLVLKDPGGNPADEVRYFSGGRWPEYANGGGSSLELRDPAADNSKAEAWAASDESTNGAWINVSYRLVAQQIPYLRQATVLDGQWRDFILGLQAAGECLIDDFSVIQTPLTTPLQCIANGNFDSGLTGWRVLGTHNLSRVVPDPDSPGNNVLHLVATGPQEHMHNHIETTFISGRSITTGVEYQISYRVRWLAGSSLLNTRLYFNRVGRTTELPYPAYNGTPGRRNSRWEPNIGPTLSGFGHQPVVPQPGVPVTVTATAQDPHGVASAEVWWSVNSGVWTSAAMSAQGGGVFNGTIPGRAAGDVVQFHVRAVDGLGAVAMFPARGTNSGALYKVSDGQANLALSHNVRVIVTPSIIDLMHGVAQGNNQTNVMSNELFPCTIVYDESRAYYDCGVHLRGSQRGRYSDVRTGFHIEFQPDDLFRGVNPVMLVDRSGAGDATANRQEEIILKHMLNRAGGLPGTYGEIARLIAPRSAHTGPCQFFPRHEDVFIESAFENGADGTQFEMELIYWPTSANAAGYKLPQPDDVAGLDLSNLGNDKETYRYNFMLKNHRDTDDYRAFIQFCKTLSLSGAQLDAQSRQIMDVNQWMRAYAMVSLGSVGDMYSFGNEHNFFTYQRPTDGKFIYMPWDMDFTFTRGSSGALVGDRNIANVVNLPGNLRCLYAHMLDIIGTCFNTSYMTYWTAHYASFAPGQSYAAHLTTIGARATFVINTINGQGGNAAFNVTSSTNFTTGTNLVVITGTAPVTAHTIRINSNEYPIVWTSISAWTIRVPVGAGAQVLNVTGYDVNGNPLTNLTRTVTVNYTGPVPDPAGRVVINEIMYNPIAPEASYVELINTSTNLSFDLSGWRLNGMDFTFPDGSILTNRGFVVVANSMPGYVAAYGTNAPVPLATYGGQLQNDGETLTLLRPGAVPGQDIEVDKVRYESVRPWPTTPNGTGPSLQLIDATQDNSRPSAWAAGGAWTKVTRTANISTATNLLLWLPAAGNCFIDDISLIATSAGGTNIVLNGDFESALSGPWILPAIYSTSYITNGVAHSGNGSLFINGTAGGSGLNVIQQWIGPRVPINMECTLSYWILLNTNVVTVRMRTLPGSAIDTTGIAQSIIATPGVNNSFAESLPPYDPLWLNELQASNVAGITDNFGDRDPWVEIYNGGSNTVSLDGYFLADNYDTNLQQWPFPSGVTVGPGQFKMVWVDGEAQESVGVTHLHANFRLQSTTGTVALVRSVAGTAQITDYLTYAGLGAGRSYGDYPDGQPFSRQEFFRVTPGTANDNTAPPLVVFINEWMADNSGTLLNTNHNNEFDDWFELYNPGNSPANLAGYFLTDNLSNKLQFAIPPGFVIPPHGFKLVWADGAPSLNDTNNPDLHVSFKLNQNGEHIGLFAIDGTLIDAVVFEPQFNNISQGRFPDGPTTNYFLAAPTPRASNTIWINRCPTLDPIPDATAYLDTLFTFTAVGADPDAPPQTLVYSLDRPAPTNASVNPITGAFAWTPTALQTPGTNVLTLRVTDNGPLALSAAHTFTVITRVPLLLGGVMVKANGDFEFTVGAVVGKTYRVEFKDTLDAVMWTPLGPDRVATSTALIITDNIGGNPNRFYRVLLLD